MNILFLSRWYPYPANNGSKIRIYNLLRGLSQHHRVSLISFYEPAQGEPDCQALGSICQEVQTVAWQSFRPQSWRARLGFFSPTPRAYLDMHSREMERRIRDTLSRLQIDLVIASQIDMAGYAPAFRGVPAVFEEVETGVYLDRMAHTSTRLERLRYRLTWAKLRRYLASLIKQFRLCTVVSHREQQILQREVIGGAWVEVIPNCLDLSFYPPSNRALQPDSLIFTGSFSYEPNYQAMRWFLQEIFPLVRQQVPSTRLVITGDHRNLSLPCEEGVTLTGMVADVRPYLAQAWCAVAPLQTGGGTRLKVLEAMAMGTPVVSTSKGAEGLDIEPGVHGFIADEPAAFAKAIVELFRNPELRRNVSANAYQLVQQRYNWEAVMPRFLGLIDQVAMGGKAAASASNSFQQVRVHRL